jgi:RNA polymerase sigma-70 factor (ECF subfamily)
VTAKQQEDVFKIWVDQYKGLFFKIVRAYAVTSMDMDDLFQEIAIQVWRSVPSFREACSVSTWIYRIAINTALTWTRKERRHPQMEGIEEGVSLLREEGETPDERLAWLYAAIHQMDAVDRSITLLLLEGFSYKEIAAIMGITESNVGVKINRIKKRLIAKSEKKDCYGL